MSQVSYGTITITDTTDIERIYTVYAKSANNTTVPSIAKESWSENVSTAPGTGNYIWQRTVVEKSGTGDKTYSDPVCLTGEEGTDATEISGIEVRYGISADWNTQPTSWSVDTPAYDSSKPKYWTRTRLIYDTNPVTYSDSVYTKDEALTKAVADAAIANSVAQHANEDAQGAMSQSANGIASIYRVWYRTNTTTAPSKPPAHVTSEADDVNNTWTTVKPKENADNRYYFYCEETVTNGGVSSWTNPVLDTSNLSQYEIGALTTKVKNFWWNSDGAHIASGINGADVDKNSPVSAYGFNSLVGLTGISFGYNNAKVIDLNTTPSPTSLKFYQPPTISGSTVTQGALAMELSSNALKFYGSSASTPDASLSSTGLNLAKGSITLGDYFSVTNTGVLTAKSGTIGGWSFTDAALYYSNATPGYSTTNLVISKSSAVNTNAIAGSETNKHWFLAAGRKFGVDTEGNLYANNAHLSSATVEGAITATQLTINGGGATYDGASAINANGYTIEIIDDETAAPTGSVITENQTYLYPVMYLNGVAVTTGITKTNYIWYTNENIATTGGVAGDSANGGIIATYGNTYRVTYNLSDDAVGTTPSQQTIYTSDARHITDISSSGITIHPEDGTAGNYMQLDSDGLKIYKSSTLLANYGTTVTIGSSSAKNVYIDSNGVQIRDSATSLAEFGTTARIGQSTSSRFLMNSDSLQAYDHDNSLYFEVNSNGLTWGSGNTAATTTQVNTAAQTATNFLSFDDTNGLQLASSSPSTATRKVQILSDAIRIKNNDTNYLNIDSTGIQLHKGGRKIADFGTNIILGPEGGPHTEITSSNVDFYVRSGLSSRKAMSIENDGCFKVYQSDNSPIMIAGKLDSWSGILLGSTDLNTTGGRLLGSGNSYGDDTYTTHRATLSLSAYAESPTGTGYASGTLSLTASANNGSNSNHIIIRGTTDGTGGIESSATIVVNSDERLKENCIYINHISDLLLKIQPIVYSWKDKRIIQRCFGFKAQDVRAALDEVVENVDDYALVSKNDNGYYNLSYTELIPLIVDIIQKQEKRIAELEIRLEGGDK